MKNALVTVRTVLIITAMLLLTACGTIPERNPVPEGDGTLAKIPGMPYPVRFWGDETPEHYVTLMRELSPSQLQAELPAITGTQHHYLAISGGGQDGAFGAGLLNGWTRAGTRPEFTMVTGISTGALTAPFAFLGPDYDEELTAVYTSFETADLLELRPWSVIATSDAALDASQLRNIIEKYIDDEMLAQLAEASRGGRRLFVGTTHLDARRPVIWNITAIAASGNPEAQKLIVDILMASASIPGAFPPVLFEVERNGELYDELHVDGGASQQVFVYPSTIDWPAILRKLDAKGRPQIYVIRNSRIKPHWRPVKPDIFRIASISVSSLIRTQGVGDLDRIFSTTQRDGGDFHLAYIPNAFIERPEETFDQPYMKNLYDLGYNMAKDSFPWSETPPGWTVTPFD
jgi:predicted acylesterase/phospholipase RssA